MYLRTLFLLVAPTLITAYPIPGGALRKFPCTGCHSGSTREGSRSANTAPTDIRRESPTHGAGSSAQPPLQAGGPSHAVSTQTGESPRTTTPRADRSPSGSREGSPARGDGGGSGSSSSSYRSATGHPLGGISHPILPTQSFLTRPTSPTSPGYHAKLTVYHANTERHFNRQFSRTPAPPASSAGFTLARLAPYSSLHYAHEDLLSARADLKAHHERHPDQPQGRSRARTSPAIRHAEFFAKTHVDSVNRMRDRTVDLNSHRLVMAQGMHEAAKHTWEADRLRGA